MDRTLAVCRLRARTTATFIAGGSLARTIMPANAGGEMLTLIAVVGILAQTGADQQWLAKLAAADRLLREVRTADAPAAHDRAPRIADDTLHA